MSRKKRPNSRRPGDRVVSSGPKAQAGPRSGVPSRTTADDQADALAAEQQPQAGALYPQVLRTPGHSWLRAVGGVVIGISLFLLLIPVISQVVIAIGWKIGGSGLSYRDYYTSAARFERPSGMLGTNSGLTALIGLSMFLMVFAHRVRPRWLSSVRPGLRGRYLAWAMVVAVLALGGVLALSALVKPPTHFAPQPGFWAFLVVIVLTSPLQAIGEEYFFRGYLMQALGSLVANPWFGIITSSLIFALFHGVQSPALFADRLVFGLLAAILVTWTGGLEASIAAHVINNVMAFTLAGLTSSVAAVRGIQTIGWTDAAFDIGGFALFALLAWLLARRMKLQTTVGGGTSISGLGVHGPVQ